MVEQEKIDFERKRADAAQKMDDNLIRAIRAYPSTRNPNELRYRQIFVPDDYGTRPDNEPADERLPRKVKETWG